MADTVSLILANDAQIATLSARVARLEEALRETLEIARRNEDGAYVERALAALSEKGARG